MQDRLIELWRARPRLIVGSALGVVALATLGAFALNTGGGKVGERGPGLDIAVVAPVEPDIQPGGRMEVGALVNDFDATAIPAAAGAETLPDDYHVEQPAYTDDERGPPVRRYSSDAGPPPDDWRTVERRGDRMGLGFDGSRPESGAEREARLEAQGRPVRRPPQDRPSGDPDAAFY